jgi:predicted peroxiredoxin
MRNWVLSQERILMQRLLLRSLPLLAGIAIGALFFAPQRGHGYDANAMKGAPAQNPLFINMTTGDNWRGWMGLHFAHATLKMGHPVTVFLNLDAVKLAATGDQQDKKGAQARMPREIIAEFIRDGGVVLMCGPCMQELGLKMDDLVPGVKMGRPGLTQGFIFAENAKTLTW